MQPAVPHNRVYAFGSNGSGQLGIGHADDVSSPQPGLSYPGASITAIATGGNHTVILFDDGKIATAGDNSDGRCLATTGTNTNILKAAHGFTTGSVARVVMHVAATWTTTIASCKDGTVWSCGSGEAGELGLGDGVIIAQQPRLIEGFPPPGTSIVSMASCMAHVVLVLSNGEVWGWGRGRKGQLGEPVEIVWAPRQIQGIGFFAVHAECGKDFTCVFGRPSTGEIMMSGPNGADRFRLREGMPSNVMGWKQTSASWGSVFVLLDSGRLVAWGRDDHGQLPPPNLPPLTAIAAGSEHCLGLTQTGEVLAWGWGEHGNCGIPIHQNGDVRSRWNECHLPRLAIAIYGGCATSFLVCGEQQTNVITGDMPG